MTVASAGALTTSFCSGLSGFHLFSLRSGSGGVRVLGSLRGAVGIESLRHLDDRGGLPLACSHHHHLSGNTGAAGCTFSARFTRNSCLRGCEATLSSRGARGTHEILLCFHEDCIWQPLFDILLRIVAGII